MQDENEDKSITRREIFAKGSKAAVKIAAGGGFVTALVGCSDQSTPKENFTEDQIKRIVRGELKRFKFSLDTDANSGVALRGINSDMTVEGWQLLKRQLAKLGFEGSQNFITGEVKGVAVVRADSVIILVDKETLRKFVELTEIDFPGKDTVLPDLMSTSNKYR